VTAPGGYGKSRLAAQLCANLLHRFEHGVFMVYLAPVRESIDVPTAVANALGYQFTAGRTPEQQLCDYLRAKDLLLCLDNFEHVLDSAPLVAELLQAAPRLKVVITSREPLRIEGEHIYRLEPLGVATGDGSYSDAELLFADRAALVKQGYALTPENAAQVRHFCEHLSGIPLAIELAAAWIDSFTLDELHDELSSRLELEARTSDKPQRHQSLQACLDWSWQLLGEEQQEALMKLSTFRGGFFSDAASAVLGLKGMKLRSTLARLADKSWLYSREVDGQTRFYLRDMLAHEYAFARLQETGRAAVPGRSPKSAPGRAPSQTLFEQAVRQHAEYFAALAEREGPRLRGGGTPDGGAAQLAALRCWRLEQDNVQEALDSALRRGEISWLLAISRNLVLFLEGACEYGAQRDRCILLLEAAQNGGYTELLMQAQLGLGRAHWRLSNYTAARASLEQALALSHELCDSASQALSLNYLGILEYSLGNYGAGWKRLEQSQALYRELGDRHGETSCVHNFALLALWQDNYDVAREMFEQALVLYRELGHRGGEASCLNNLAHAEIRQGDYNAAQSLLESALDLFREQIDRNGKTVCLLYLGVVEEKLGNYRAARSLYEQTLALSRELGNRSIEVGCLNNLGIVELCQGSYETARELYEQALALFRELGDRNGEAASLGNLGIVELCQDSFGAARELLEQSLVLNLELGNRNNRAENLRSIGILEISRGHYRDAREPLERALALFHEVGDKPGIAGTCANAGTVLAAMGQTRAGALAIYGGQHCAEELRHSIEPHKRKALDSSLARLEAAVADGSISAEILAQWKAEAKALSLDELAEFVQAELAKVNGVLPEGEAIQQAGA
jgi:predicted ATPase/Tfp pilus assembly protein PilF